jgi:hypothetical protein
MALALPRVARHPNRQPFRGVLTLIDTPSDRAPAGARGHRVVLTRAAAERALPSLLGMGLDFTSSFDGHDVRRKVGIITSADLVPLLTTKLSEEHGSVGQGFSLDSRSDRAGKNHLIERASAPEAHSKLKTKNSKLIVTGFLFARDFPDVIRELRLRSASLGMSYEVANAGVRDLRDRIWVLDDVTFTGAAVLHRHKAAYQNTSIELTSDF